MSDGHEGINPALEDLNFCPRCGQPPTIDYPRSITCPQCGYAAFYNPKPVAAIIPIEPNGDILLMRRGFEPRRGHWSLPGGFVDLGESVADAGVREVMEELHLEVEISHLVGVYSRAEDRTVVVVYAAATRGTPSLSEEALEVRAFAPIHIPWQDLAFWSEEHALRDYLASAGEGVPS